MEAKEAIKLEKKIHRAAFTKAFNVLEEILKKSDINSSELQSELNVFVSKAQRLEDTQVRYLSTLSGNEIEAEFYIIEDYRDKAVRIETKVKDILQNLQNVSTSNLILNQSVNENVCKRTFKLPKLELRKFDGEIKEWLFFWSQFEKTDKDTTISDSDKFQYLLQATVEGSRAREVIESFPPTTANYPKVIECLKARFGRNDLQVEVYVRELLKLVLKNANCIESYLPEDFLRAYQRSANADHGADPKCRLDSLLKFLKSEVESEERISLAMAGFGLKNEVTCGIKSIKTVHDRPLTAASLMSTDSSAKKCVFCSGKHDSFNCFKAQKMTFSERQKLLKDKGHCFRCLKADHCANKCRSSIKCAICHKSVIMCLELLKNKTNVKKPMLNSNEKETSKEESSVNLSSVSNTPQVLLQTLKVKIIGNNCTLCVRALYDTGSQKSYLRKNLISSLGLIPSRKQILSHALFGGERTPENVHNVYKIKLKSLHDNFNCTFDIYEQDTICDAVPSALNGPWIKELRSMNIPFYDTEDSSGPIDLLIGADVAGRLFTDRKIVLSSGSVAIETYLAWTLIGKTSVNAEREDKAMTIVTMFVKDANISDLFSLDILRISDLVEHFLPHRPVVQEHGTTKVRPVSDASARQIGSPSLNQCLESGPNLLELIPSLLLIFREFKYGVIADIEKAFLQVSVRPEERNYLRFFWWNDSDCKEVKVMQHNRLVFGVKSSPFLLGAVLDYHLGKHLNDARYNQDYVKILISSFYVDNLVTSLNDTCDILPFIETSQAILSEGKFNLRDWQYTNDNGPEPFTSV
ncbi:uncharacterized protein LOC118185223 [Stegodyphus dumicola]|uniref:uncharacterized protein LOC118185223 n=1 Tax=Stegodyphus dumicola TaxID=202533 RepID=UPI0015AF76EE|nr:uncharacterized protein LOC118185223 [Stegodyphus dumicola]